MVLPTCGVKSLGALGTANLADEKRGSAMKLAEATMPMMLMVLNSFLTIAQYENHVNAQINTK
jgi:hypothetical protein